MLLEEFDMEEVKACWKKEAAEEATNRTVGRIGKLNKILLSQKRYDDLEKASDDSAYLIKLLDKYGI